MYPIIEVPNSAWAAEQLGTKYKFWFLNEQNRPVLFKQGREGTGENWSEKVSCEIAELLGMPHAHYDLARWRTIQGVTSLTLLEEGESLVLGNQILPPTDSKKYRENHHTVQRVMALMRSPNIVPCLHPQMDTRLSVSDIFVGYLMLDALVGNSDRHHENWALIWSPTNIRLSPTFDHASCLGRNESDERREQRLITRDKGNSVEAYATRTRSALFLKKEDPKPLLTTDAFLAAAAYCPTGKNYWLQRLSTLNDEKIREVLYDIPDDFISEPARKFALAMLIFNRNRLLSENV